MKNGIFDKMSLKHKNLIQYILAISIICILSLIAQSHILKEMPTGMHRWGQSDHFAVTQGFTENNLNLFKPQTYILNPPRSKAHVDVLEGITRVDFPVYHYVVAVIMKVTGSESPLVYRLTSLIISIAGLFFLFMLAKRFTRSFLISIMLVLFVLSLPVYLYYQVNFLPSFPAFSFCLIGYYFYFNYVIEKKKFNYFILSVVFFTFAILFRLPYAIPLIAVGIQQVISYIQNKKIEFKEILVFSGSFVLVGLYFLYNHFMGKKYGSIYLGQILPPHSFEEFKEIWGRIDIKNHQTHDLIRWFVSLTFINSLIYFGVMKGLKKFKMTLFQKKLGMQTIFLLLVGLTYSILMMHQYVYHDYYFVDSLYLGVIMLVFFFLTFLKWENKYINYSITGFLLLLLVFAFPRSIKQERNWEKVNVGEWDYFFEDNIRDIESLFDKHQVSKESIIYVMDEGLQANMAFCQIRRKGFCWDGFGKDQHEKWISLSDYVVMSEKFLNDKAIPADSLLFEKVSIVDKENTMILMRKKDAIE